MLQSKKIFYLEMDIEYLYGKKYKRAFVYTLANTDDLMDIMDDKLAMGTIERQVYPFNYGKETGKSKPKTRKIIIKKVTLCKQLNQG